MIRGVACFVGLICATWGGACLASSTPIAGLPPSAVIISRVHVTGSPMLDAVVFRTNGDYIGLVSVSKSQERVVKVKALQGEYSRMQSNQAGTVLVLSVAGVGKQDVCAYSVARQNFASAVENNESGCVSGDRGIRLRARSVTVFSADSRHAGSVHYKFAVRYEWKTDSLVRVWKHRLPDYSAQNMPLPNVTVQTAEGNTILLRLEVASTPAQQETGLMNRRQLDPDSGMIFTWSQPVHESFWMENTLIPLTVAFLAPDGTLQETQDMQPLTTDLHTPLQPYQYAIEANLGFFAQSGIHVGDRFVLHLQSPSDRHSNTVSGLSQNLDDSLLVPLA